MTKPVNIKRLLKLADFLDKLPRKSFDFSCTREERSCGSVGCAIGWTPNVFPRLVAMTGGDWPMFGMKIRDGGDVECYLDYDDLGAELFNMPAKHSSRLFTPGQASPADGRRLSASSRPTTVAKRIRVYARWAEKNKITSDSTDYEG